MVQSRRMEGRFVGFGVSLYFFLATVGASQSAVSVNLVLEWFHLTNPLAVFASSKLLIALGFSAHPDPSSPVLFTPPEPSDRLWEALAELKAAAIHHLPSSIVEELNTDKLGLARLTLGKIESVGSGTTELEKAFGFVPYTVRKPVVNPLALGSFSGVGYAEYKTSKPAPGYALLGVHDNAPDNLVIDAYNLQIRDDPAMREWYLAALKDIGDGRSSAELMARAKQEIEQGWPTIMQVIGALALVNAYEPVSTITTGRNVIDLLPVHQPKLETLRKELDVDFFVNAMSAAYFEEGSKRDELRSAAKTIARWLGPRGKPILISAKGLAEMHGETWIDEGGQDDERAFESDATLGSDSGSAKTANDDEMPDLISANGDVVSAGGLPRNPPGSPVGLVNIAQTCYLNSLLQYWFTLRTIRDDVLRRTGAIDEGEIAGDEARAAKFVGLLGKLFHNMIFSDTDAVRPERELAELALTPKSASLAAAAKHHHEEPSIGGSESTADAGDGGLLGVPLKEVADAPAVSGDVDVEMTEADALTDVETAEPAEISVAGAEIRAATPMIDRLSLSAAPPSEQAASTLTLDDAVAPIVDVEPKKSSIIDLVKGLDSFTATADLAGPEAGSVVAPAPTASPAPSVANKPKPTMTLGQQQDLTECLDNVMDMLETALKSRKRKREDSGVDQVAESHSETNAIKNLFYGLTRQHLTYTPPGTSEVKTTTKDEEFSHFLLNPVSDIRAALDQTFETGEVHLENTQAVRELGLLKAPPVLTLVINRVQFNRTTLRPFKDQSFMRFTDTLQLARYSDANLQRAKEVKKRVAVLKEELATLEAKLSAAKLGHMGDNAPTKDAVELCKETLAYLETDPFDVAGTERQFPTLGNDLTDVVSMLVDEQSRLDSEISDIELEIGKKKLELEKTWDEVDQTDPSGEFDYKLHAVFMHRGEWEALGTIFFFSDPHPCSGEASYGHYWIYIRDSATGRWYKYNDSSVSPISESDVFKRTEDSSDPTANAYCLIYVRSSEMPRLINVRARDEAIRAEYEAEGLGIGGSTVPAPPAASTPSMDETEPIQLD